MAPPSSEAPPREAGNACRQAAQARATHHTTYAQMADQPNFPLFSAFNADQQSVCCKVALLSVLVYHLSCRHPSAPPSPNESCGWCHPLLCIASRAHLFPRTCAWPLASRPWHSLSPLTGDVCWRVRLCVPCVRAASRGRGCRVVNDWCGPEPHPPVTGEAQASLRPVSARVSAGSASASPC
jgi:hypothetical protein